MFGVATSQTEIGSVPRASEACCAIVVEQRPTAATGEACRAARSGHHAIMVE